MGLKKPHKAHKRKEGKKMYYYFDIDREKLYTLDYLVQDYNRLKAENETESETFKEYLNNCMTYNNGSLDIYKVRTFKSMKAIENFLQTIDYEFIECYILKYDSKRYIDEYNEMVYEVA